MFHRSMVRKPLTAEEKHERDTNRAFFNADTFAAQGLTPIRGTDNTVPPEWYPLHCWRRGIWA